MKIITHDLSVHHLIDKLAKDFCVNPSSLKNYFHDMYGQSISAIYGVNGWKRLWNILEKVLGLLQT